MSIETYLKKTERLCAADPPPSSSSSSLTGMVTREQGAVEGGRGGRTLQIIFYVFGKVSVFFKKKTSHHLAVAVQLLLLGSVLVVVAVRRGRGRARLKGNIKRELSY